MKARAIGAARGARAPLVGSRHRASPGGGGLRHAVARVPRLGDLRSMRLEALLVAAAAVVCALVIAFAAPIVFAPKSAGALPVESDPIGSAADERPSGEPWLQPGQVPGVVVYGVDATVSGTAVKAAWAYAPGDQAVNAAVETWVAGILDSYAKNRLGQARWRPVAAPPQATGGSAVARPQTCAPGSTFADAASLAPTSAGAPVPGLVISCDVVIATGSAFATRVRATEFSVVKGASTVVSDTATTFYADLATGRVESQDQLLTADGRAQIEALALQLATAVGEPGAPTSSPRIDSLGFTATGLVANIAAPAAGGAAGRPSVSVPSPQSDVMLSAFGRDFAAIVERGEPTVVAPKAAGLTRTPCSLVACVALTYDDGPGEDTPRLLDELAARGATASFFMVGKNAAARPETVARIAAEGHTLGNHTYDHMFLLVTPRDVAVQQIQATDAVIQAAAGRPADYFRPPWGAYNPKEIGNYAHPIALWDIDTLDWQDQGTDAILARVQPKVSPGSVLLMHDTHHGTVDAAPALIDALQARGYYTVGLGSMFPAPPKVGAIVVSQGDVRGNA